MSTGIFLVPATLDALKQKGVEKMLEEREREAYFNRIITVHPFAERRQSVVLSEAHVVEEFGPGDLVGVCWVARVVRVLRTRWEVLRWLREEIRRGDVGLIRAQDPFHTALYAFLGSAGQRTPYCISIHSDYEFREKLDEGILPKFMGSRRLAAWISGLLLRRATGILPIRAYMKSALIKRGVRDERVHVIPHGIDLSPFLAPLPPREELVEGTEIRPDAPWVVFAGRLAKENYVYDMVAVASEVQKIQPEIEFIMFGSGKEAGPLQEMAAKLAARVHLPGPVERDRICQFRRHANVNLALMGGFSLIEACASARPVLSYDIEWHSEILGSIDGALMREGDLGAIADFIQREVSLTSDVARWRALSEKVRLDYSLERSLKRKREIYAEISKQINE